ncbi:hypothetical protein QE152_g23481 [Popillia japonica]|uniref:Uncharacterized protein n=1 Tax=Popillia japonica TaxID=7064 RepID=A0AAW1KF56_POPJA
MLSTNEYYLEHDTRDHIKLRVIKQNPDCLDRSFPLTSCLEHDTRDHIKLRVIKQNPDCLDRSFPLTSCKRNTKQTEGISWFTEEPRKIKIYEY